MKNVIISNPENFEKTKKNILLGDVDNLQVIADFDRTLTHAFVNEEFIPAVMAIFASENYLPKEFNKKEKELFEKYHPIEISSSLSLEEKRNKMEQWWEEMSQNLIDFSLNKSIFEQAAKSPKIVLRDKVLESFSLLKKYNVPMIIFSASGLGDESIIEILKHKDIYFDNIQVISNKFMWDKKGYAIESIKPHIHVFNKNEAACNNPLFNKVKSRKNVILLGDGLGDIHMADGVEHENILKVGFLNYHVEEKLEEYKKHFDVVLINDTSNEFVYELLLEFSKDIYINQ